MYTDYRIKSRSSAIQLERKPAEITDVFFGRYLIPPDAPYGLNLALTYSTNPNGPKGVLTLTSMEDIQSLMSSMKACQVEQLIGQKVSGRTLDGVLFGVSLID